MNNVTPQDFYAADQKLAALGLIPQQDIETLPASDSLGTWLQHRCRYVERATLHAMLAEQIGLDIIDQSKAGPGFWWKGCFIPYKAEANSVNNAVLSTLVIEGASSPYGFLVNSNNIGQASIETAFWGMLSQYKVEKLTGRVEEPQLVATERFVSVKMGNVKIPLIDVSHYAGSLITKGKLSAASGNASLSFWQDVFSEIESQGDYGRIHFICGEHIDFDESVFSGTSVRVLHCKDLVEHDILKINSPTVIKSDATCLSELLASMLHIPIYAWVEKISSLHIRYNVPKLCKHCKMLEKGRPSFAQLHYNFSLSEGDFYVSGVGCEKCFWGYSGCAVIEEKVTLGNKNLFIKAINEYVKKNEGRSHPNVYEIYPSAHEAKYHTTFEAVSKLVATGNVSIDDIIKQIF